MYRIFGNVTYLIWPIVIIGIIVYFLGRRGKRFPLVSYKEDVVSQWFFLLSLLFLGITLFALDRDFGDPLPWRSIILLTSVFGLVISYYFKVILTLIFSLAGVMIWWGVQASFWIQGKDIKTSSILVGLVFIALFFYSLGHLHEKILKYKRFSLIYLVISIVFITVLLFIFSSKPGLTLLSEMTRGGLFFVSWQTTLSLTLFFVSLVGVSLFAVKRKFILMPEAAAVFILAILFGITAFLPQQTIFMQTGNYLGDYTGSGSELSTNGVLWAIVFNISLFFELLGLIFSGLLRKEEWLINLGTIFLFLLIIVKYFDWFFTFLNKSVFFIGAGILLFGVGWSMEKGRRYIISNIKPKGEK